jgi:hypothetical protein
MSGQSVRSLSLEREEKRFVICQLAPAIARVAYPAQQTHNALVSYPSLLIPLARSAPWSACRSSSEFPSDLEPNERKSTLPTRRVITTAVVASHRPVIGAHKLEHSVSLYEWLSYLLVATIEELPRCRLRDQNGS